MEKQELKTVTIKNNEYVQVNERIRYFRESYKGYRLTSDIISLEGGVCVIKAEIYDENGNLVATGHAYEKEGNGFINKTSYIENCETSAWGRALGNLGIGIETSVASSDEVENAIAQQDALKSEKKELPKKIKLEYPDLDTDELNRLTLATCQAFGFANWKTYDNSRISGNAFIGKLRQIKESGDY